MLEILVKIGQAAIRRCIREELLPRYDIRTALSLLAYLKRFGQVSRCLIQVLMFLACLFILYLLIGCSTDYNWTKSWIPLPWMLFVTIATPASIFLIGLLGFGPRSGIDLLLPRITGGIAIGYFPLLIADMPWYLPLYLSQHHGIWLFEWLLVWLIMGVYLSREVYPSILQHWEAVKRSSKVLAWATVQAILFGFLFIGFSAPIYRQLEFDTRRVNSESSIYTQVKLPCFRSDDDQKKSVAEGLEYCVDLPVVQEKFPISALLTFAPIALMLGIILQILWEEKPVTASVWPSESRFWQ